MAFSAPDPAAERAAAEPRVDTAAEPRVDTAAEPRTDPTGQPRNPLLAVLGAGDAAVAAVARAFADAFSAAAENRRTVQQRVADIPTEIEALRGRFSGDDLRRALEAYRLQVERAYGELAGRGEEAWGRLREQPQVRQAITTREAYTEKLDGRVDDLVDDAQEAAARVRAAAERRARATGETVAQAGQRLTGRAADALVDVSASTADAVEDAGAAVVDASVATADAVADAGTATAEAIEEAGATSRKGGGKRSEPDARPDGAAESSDLVPPKARRSPRKTPPTSG
jgi:heparin binding hemagglutinin HbhA